MRTYGAKPRRPIKRFRLSADAIPDQDSQAGLLGKTVASVAAREGRSLIINALDMVLSAELEGDEYQRVKQTLGVREGRGLIGFSPHYLRLGGRKKIVGFSIVDPLRPPKFNAVPLIPRNAEEFKSLINKCISASAVHRRDLEYAEKKLGMKGDNLGAVEGPLAWHLRAWGIYDYLLEFPDSAPFGELMSRVQFTLNAQACLDYLLTLSGVVTTLGYIIPATPEDNNSTPEQFKSAVEIVSSAISGRHSNNETFARLIVHYNRWPNGPNGEKRMISPIYMAGLLARYGASLMTQVALIHASAVLDGHKPKFSVEENTKPKGPSSNLGDIL